MAVSAPARRAPTPTAKSAARKPLFLIGIAMAVVAFFLVIVLGSVVAGRATAGVTLVAVVVAADDIAHRQTITRADLATSKLPTTAVPPGTLLSADAAVGKVAQVPVLKGQPITSNLIAAPGAGDPSLLPIPPGWDAFTIPASEQQAVAGYIAPGDVIDIQATVTEPGVKPTVATPRRLTRPVFH